MSQGKIEKLTPEQEALIPVYVEKWLKIALSTEPIDREKAAEAVKEGYCLVGLPIPKIIFSDSPYTGLSYLDSLGINYRERNSLSLNLDDFCDPLRVETFYYFNNGRWQNYNYLDSDGVWKKRPDFNEQLQNIPRHKVASELWGELRRKLYGTIWQDLWQELYYIGWDQLTQLGYEHFGARKLGSFYGNCIIYDLYLSVISKDGQPNPWQVYISLAANCGWILPTEKLCIVCDRPRILSFDDQNRLHAEGAPAIQFADGYSLYAYHGVTLPEKYGKIHPNQWQASWLLEEQNAELRRVLIQGIGYSRIASELGATELDSFQEYSLLKIDTDVDIEPIYMLKMTCPSTGYIHVLRVPPNINSAKEAITWVNWGIDPEEFAVQT